MRYLLILFVLVFLVPLACDEGEVGYAPLATVHVVDPGLGETESVEAGSPTPALTPTPTNACYVGRELDLGETCTVEDHIPQFRLRVDERGLGRVEYIDEEYAKPIVDPTVLELHTRIMDWSTMAHLTRMHRQEDGTWKIDAIEAQNWTESSFVPHRAYKTDAEGNLVQVTPVPTPTPSVRLTLPSCRAGMTIRRNGGCQLEDLHIPYRSDTDARTINLNAYKFAFEGGKFYAIAGGGEDHLQFSGPFHVIMETHGYGIDEPYITILRGKPAGFVWIIDAVWEPMPVGQQPKRE